MRFDPRHDKPAEPSRPPGDTVAAEASAGAAGAQAAARDRSGQPPTPAWSTWELNEQLRHVERVLAMGTAQDIEIEKRRRRVDPPHALGRSASAGAAPVRPSAGQGVVAFFAWTVMAVGTLGLTFGAVLAGWGWIVGREQLVDVGLPALLGGQLILVAGLGLCWIGVRWSFRRNARDPAESIDERLNRIGQSLEKRF
ncbi:MAG TPA: hypothetical protein VHZ24_18020 [Pirellulales bacterium]|nr:hypothetical protein [Pirellulales bacterium]